MASRSLLRVAGRLVVESIRCRNPGSWLPIVIGDPHVIMALSSCWCHLQWGTSTSAPSHGTMWRSSSRELIDIAAGCGFLMRRQKGDRTDVPIDFRFLDLLLRTAGDPEVGLGEYAQGVRVQRARGWRDCLRFTNPERKWRLASQMDSFDYLEHSPDQGGVWRRNYSTSPGGYGKPGQPWADHRDDRTGSERKISQFGDCLSWGAAEGEAWRQSVGTSCLRLLR